MAEISRQSKSKLHIDEKKVSDLIGKKADVTDATKADEMMTKEFGCKGTDKTWIESFIKGLKKGNEIHMIKSAENLLKLGKIVNDVTDKLQKITQDSKYYFVEDTKEVQTFISKCNQLCDKIREYSEMIIANKVERVESPEDTMNRYFKSIMYQYHKEFIQQYNTVKEYINNVKEFKIPDDKPDKDLDPKLFSILKSILSGTTIKALSKLWELKIYLYITGVLIYNIHVYMFPPSINSMLDNLIKIFGVICYTASTDPVIFNNCVKIINTIIMKLGALAFMCISPFLFAIIDSKLLQGVNSIMSYIFTIYCFGWLSKILVAICNTITVFKPAVNAGVTSTSQTLSTVIQVIKDAGISTQEFGLNVGTYAIKMFAQMSPAILEGFLVFFTNYAATTASSVYKYLQNKFGAGTQSVANLINSILSAWTGSGKQIVQFDMGQNSVDIVRQKPLMIIDSGSQVVAAELLKLILNEKGINEFKGDSDKSLSDQILSIDNPLFNYAITVNDKGQYFIDPNVIHENLQNMIQINITDIVDKGVNETITNVTETFNHNFEAAIAAAGLTFLVADMSEHLNSDYANIPGMILLHLFKADELYNLISKNKGSFQTVILYVAVICVVLAIVTLK
jgi:hypothetical protein